MSYLKEIVKKLLYRESNLCCLCLKSIEGERTDLDDEVVLLESRSVQENAKISEIFSYVFDDEVVTKISVFEDICKQCVAATVNTYKFIKDAKNNLQYLVNAVEYIENSLNHTEQNNEGYNSFFMALTSDLSRSGHYYDNINLTSDVSEILKKFDFMQKAKSDSYFKTPTKVKRETDIGHGKKKSIDTRRDKLDSFDMLCDKGNPDDIRCKCCFRKFETITKLSNHYMRIHAPKTFQCPDCPKRYGSLSLLNSHRTASHCENLMCADCGKVFSNPYTLKEHEKTHHLQIICPDCGRVYKNRNTFKKHKDNNVCQIIGRHSPADAKFTCDYCQKKYTQKMSLRVHIQYVHGNYKSHECKWCKKKFWCQARLKAHIVKHTKEKNFTCSICNRSFVTKESLLYHTRIHTGERPYACHLCDSRFLSASRRMAHIRSQHTNPITCNICNNKFKSVHYLLKHKKTHEEQKDGKEKNLFVLTSSDEKEHEEAVSNIQNVEQQDNVDLQPFNKNFRYILVDGTKEPQVYTEVSAIIEV